MTRPRPKAVLAAFAVLLWLAGLVPLLAGGLQVSFNEKLMPCVMHPRGSACFGLHLYPVLAAGWYADRLHRAQ